MSEMLAWIGDGGEPEAVIPLSKINDVIASTASDSFSESITFAPKITIEGNADKETVSAAVKMTFVEFQQYMEQWLRERKRIAF